jgi:hypothetical protein
MAKKKKKTITFIYISSPSAFRMSFHTSFSSLFSATAMQEHILLSNIKVELYKNVTASRVEGSRP